MVDYVAKDGSTALEGGRAQQVPVELGSKRSLPGFEEGLRGVAKGGKASIKVPFPAEHPNSQLAGKQIEFTVHVHDVREKQLPALDDDLAKQMGPYQTLAELKAKLAETLKAQSEARRKTALAEQAGEALNAMHGFQVPSVMVDAEVDYLVDRERQELERRNMAFRTDEGNLGALRAELRPQAEKRARLSLVLEQLAQREGLVVSDEEYRKEMARFAQVMRASEAEILKWAKETGREEGIKARLLNDKAMDWVLSKAQVSPA
jgi:trigger factor